MMDVKNATLALYIILLSRSTFSSIEKLTDGMKISCSEVILL